MIDKALIKELVEQHLVNSPHFLVDITIKSGNMIFVSIDGAGVTIDDCVRLSRFIEGRLDRDREDFELSVSSAGLGQAFKVLDQYRINIGKEIEVITKDGNKRNGILLKATEECIELNLISENGRKKKDLNEKVAISLKDIKSAKKTIKFN